MSCQMSSLRIKPNCKKKKEQGKIPCSFVFLWYAQDKEKTQPNHSFVTK